MQVDVAVVGAGPAGARAAYVLAKRGARVLVLDASHPREKPCGGGVTGRAFALVADALDLEALTRTAVRTARFTSAGSVDAVAATRAALPQASSRSDAVVVLDADAIVVSSRATFDAALVDAAERAGARVDRSRVKSVSPDGAGVDIVTAGGRHRAGFVIGADGANSLVRRQLSRAFRRDQLSVATGYFAHGVTSEEIVIELTGRPAGYIWSFPRPDHLAIGICAQADAGFSAGALRGLTGEWIRATRIAAGAVLEPYSWPIPSLSARDFDRLPVAGPRWALVGDAAGLVDPITREGIYYALASGEWIADAVAMADPARRYEERLRDEALGELACAARLKAGFFRPAFIGLIVRALQHSAPIREVMADLVAGRQSYATLKWRLIKTLEIGLAWRALTA